MYRKTLITILAAFMAVISVNALTAEQILKRTADKVNSAPSASFRFTATTGDGAKTSGTLTMAKQCFTMITDVQSVWYDGKTLWSYSPASSETSVTEPLPEELLEINPFDILNQSSSRFTVKKLSPIGKDDRIELNARKQQMSVRRAVMVVDAATGLPKAIDVTFANSARMNIVISSSAIGKPLPKSTFTYPKSKYPKSEIVDLR